ncbi:MAG: 3-methyl-2-oxobutanoate hydroxymethyltransferase [Anaerolineae bacterium]|jgi:3-methyl-2-oxobutanoate hydroxymethyltransferase|nr:3-methyl-2-oxobutanoate hydroxymethyltransferase [Anaerolineae bacterium]
MRLTIRDIQKMKDTGQPIVMLTAYDAPSARLAEAADIPTLLVGDSLGMVIQGRDSTVQVRLEHMIYHCEIVSRVTQRPLVIGDLPFMSYKVSPEQALTNAARLMQEGGVGAVKVEGGESLAPIVERIVSSGIPVMGHIGLTPQSVNQFGGFRVQGREADSAFRLVKDALAIEAAGAFGVVLELVPTPLAAYISSLLRIPTIGIGAGAGCDGQVQVYHDLFALAGEFLPKHAKQYAQIGDLIRDALRHYAADVQARTFPDASHGFTQKDEVMAELRAQVETELGIKPRKDTPS